MRVRAWLSPIRRMLAVLLALAILLAPAVAPLGMAFASTSSPMQMQQGGHCQVEPVIPTDHDKSGKTCCIRAGLAVTIEASAPLRDRPLQSPPLAFPVKCFWIGFLGEIATPPPRLL